MNLTTHLIKNFNARSRTAIKIHELLNKDRKYMKISKKENKTLRDKIALFVNATKTMPKRYTSCFN